MAQELLGTSDTGAPARREANRLSVIVPVYMNAGSLAKLFAELREVEASLHQRGLELQLIFVDDGSTDQSLAELLKIKSARASTTIVKLTRNFGVVPALRTGLRYVTGDAFAFLSADMQDPPALVVEMADRWLAGSKFVIAERESRDDPALSRFFSCLYYYLLRRIILPGYPAGGFDLALMDKVMLPPLRDSAKSVFLPLLAYWLGFKPDVIRYDRLPRLHGRSRWTFGKKVRAFLDVLLGFSITPIRAMSAVGIVVSTASLAYGTVHAVRALVDGDPVPGLPILAALVIFLLGLVIVMLGVLGEYLWRLLDESSRRPEAVIEEVY